MSRAEIKSLAQAIRERRASQSFDGEPMPPDDLRKILEAGLQAPSSYNLQPWRFIVVQQPEQKRSERRFSRCSWKAFLSLFWLVFG